MLNTLKNLCTLNGTSGDEKSVRDYILKQIKPYAECTVDKSGNIIAQKRGKKASAVKLMVDAHMDEVGIIVCAITNDGFLKFKTVGGIKESVLLCRKVTINGSVHGVIGCKPIHLCSAEEIKKCPKEDALYIDIGASNREEAEGMVNIGDFGVLDGAFEIMGDHCFKAKAIDDRAGCAVLIELLKQNSDYDFYATFTVQEEVGCRGAKTAAYTVNPDVAIVLEATTAADINGVPAEKQVCKLGGGAAVSFMDGGTLYNRSLYNCAMNSGIPCQPKAGTTGGNNAGGIHLTRSGVKTLALSIPCRYIHSPSCMADRRDLESLYNLSRFMINKICSGEVK